VSAIHVTAIAILQLLVCLEGQQQFFRWRRQQETTQSGVHTPSMPPGFSTRLNSMAAFTGSFQMLKQGMREHRIEAVIRERQCIGTPCLNSTLAMPWDFASRVAAATWSALKSTPVTLPGDTCFATSRVMVPGPQPQSSTLMPG